MHRRGRPIVRLIIVLVVVACAGFFVPELYDSTNLDQSSDVPAADSYRGLAAGCLVFVAGLLGWVAWRRTRRRENAGETNVRTQFGLAFVFLTTTVVAALAAALALSQQRSEYWFVGFYALIVGGGLVIGRTSFLAVSDASRADSAKSDEPVGRRRTIFAVALSVVAILLAVGWHYEFRFGLAGLVWFAVLAAALWYANYKVKVGTVCFLAAMLLPYIWLFREDPWSDDFLRLLSFFSVAPGILPAAFIRWTPDSLMLPTICLVIESLFGYWLAHRRPTILGWFSGFAFGFNLLASFGLHALFRA